MLARFRPDPATVSALEAIDGDTDDHGYPTIGPGVVTADWRKRRMIGCGQLTGMFFVPALTKSLAALRKAFMSRAAELGVPDVDAAAVRLAQPRALTQEISQWAYKAQFDTPPGRFDGVQFQSRHSDDQPCGQSTSATAPHGMARSSHTELPPSTGTTMTCGKRWKSTASRGDDPAPRPPHGVPAADCLPAAPMSSSRCAAITRLYCS